MSRSHTGPNMQSQKSFSMRDKKAKMVLEHKTPVSHLMLAWSIVMALMIALELLR
jgi:hypothetical protein